jgi:small subunit ribosomal protein S17
MSDIEEEKKTAEPETVEEGAPAEPEAAVEPEAAAAPEPEAPAEEAAAEESAVEEPVAEEVVAEAAAEEPVAEEPAAEAPAAEEPVAEEAAVEEPVADAAAAEAPAAEEAAAEAAAEAPAKEAPAQPVPSPARKRSQKHVPRSERGPRTKTQRERPATRKPIVRLEKPEHDRGRRQERRGVVVSDAMEKTIVVKVESARAHQRYKKVIRRSTKFHAHDEQNQAHVGDLVRIVETRPLSKTKRWRLAEILEVAK